MKYIFAFILLSTNILFSLGNELPEPVHIGRTSGLSHNTVNGIFKDSEGYIWLATCDGLNLYDGYKIKYFKTSAKDSNSISGNSINEIIEDHLGHIYIATNNGLNKFNKKEKRFLKYLHNSDTLNKDISNQISTVYQDEMLNIWVGNC